MTFTFEGGSQEFHYLTDKHFAYDNARRFVCRTPRFSNTLQITVKATTAPTAEPIFTDITTVLSPSTLRGQIRRRWRTMNMMYVPL